MDPLRTLLVCLLALGYLRDASPSKNHRHHREYEDDDDHHYLPPEEDHELKPFFRKDKHTSEHVVYHKGQEHHEPKRVDHYHHYDKQPEVKTKHIHYQQVTPQVRTAEILTPVQVPVATPSQIVTRRRRPNRVLYASAPNSVFHTQINVQSQDSELSSQIRTDPLLPVVAAPAGAQLPANAAPPGGGQLAVTELPNCQNPVAGNPPVGCRLIDPTGAQLGADALPPGGQLPANVGLPPGGGQLPTNANPSGGAQLPANVGVLPGGQLPVNGGLQPGNGFSQGGQLPTVGLVGNLGNGNGNANLFIDPTQLTVGRGNQNGLVNQNLFVPAVGQVQRPGSVLIQIDPAFGGQLPVGNVNGNGGRLLLGNGNGNGGLLPFGNGNGNGLRPILSTQQAVGQQNGFNLGLGGQVPVFGNGNVNGNGNGNLVGGGQFPAGGQTPAIDNGNGNGNPILGGQLPAFGNGNGNGSPAPGGQLPAGGQAPTFANGNGQLPLGGQAPTFGNGNPVLGGQQASGAQTLNPTPGAGAPSSGDLNRLNGRRNGRRLRNRSNYQGLNVVRGNAFGQPILQGPNNPVGNQQDTNIIDGNFYGYSGQLRRLVRLNGNQRSVVIGDGDYYYDDDEDTTTDIGVAASAPELRYAALDKKGSQHKDHQSAATEHGYHYKNPRRTQ